MDVAVIGSGVIGSSIAYHLARRGAKVALIDARGPAVAPSASWASAGGLRSQGRHAEDAPLTLAAAKRWAHLPQELDADLELRLGGHLHLAESAAEAALLERRMAQDRAHGIAIERLTRPEIRARWPALASSAVLGAFSPGDGQAHPGLTAHAFSRAAQRQGAVLAFGQEAAINVEQGRIAGVTTRDGTRILADTTVVAAGAWSIALLAALGLTLPLRWRALQMLLSNVMPPLLAPTVTAAGRNLSLKQLPSGQYMVGGRWLGEATGPAIGARAVADHVKRQWQAAMGILPLMRGARLAQHWLGAECQSIDSMPFIGTGHTAGLYVATGFSNHGFQISPAIGEAVAADLLDGEGALLAPFRLSRAEQFEAEDVAAFRQEGTAC